MKKQSFIVENIKCGGCANSIKSELLKIAGIQTVTVDIEKELIEVEGLEFNEVNILKKLSSMGYPEKGNNDILKQAKSYVSCAIGKMS